MRSNRVDPITSLVLSKPNCAPNGGDGEPWGGGGVAEEIAVVVAVEDDEADAPNIEEEGRQLTEEAFRAVSNLPDCSSCGCCCCMPRTEAVLRLGSMGEDPARIGLEDGSAKVMSSGEPVVALPVILMLVLLLLVFIM